MSKPKPTKKIIKSNIVVKMDKKKDTKKDKRRTKKRKQKKEKAPPAVGSRPLQKAMTTEQSQFYNDLYRRLGNSNGRANGLWNSYRNNLTAQARGGTPYEIYRLREDANALREQLERTTTQGNRRTFNSYDPPPPRNRSPPPPRNRSPSPLRNRSPSPLRNRLPSPTYSNKSSENLGFTQIAPQIEQPYDKAFTGNRDNVGGESQPAVRVHNNAMSMFQKQPTTRANAKALERTQLETSIDNQDSASMDSEDRENRQLEREVEYLDRKIEEDDIQKQLRFQQSQQTNKRFENVEGDQFKKDFDRSERQKEITKEQKDDYDEQERLIKEYYDQQKNEGEGNEDVNSDLDSDISYEVDSDLELHEIDNDLLGIGDNDQGWNTDDDGDNNDDEIYDDESDDGGGDDTSSVYSF